MAAGCTTQQGRLPASSSPPLPLLPPPSPSASPPPTGAAAPHAGPRLRQGGRRCGAGRRSGQPCMRAHMPVGEGRAGRGRRTRAGTARRGAGGARSGRPANDCCALFPSRCKGRQGRRSFPLFLACISRGILVACSALFCILACRANLPCLRFFKGGFWRRSRSRTKSIYYRR